MTSFNQIFSQNKKILSFEFFPPKKAENLANTKSLMQKLSLFKPDFMTVTYGAGGGTRGFTKELVSYIANDLSSIAVSHLTCVGHTKEQLRDIVAELKSHGISHILALRGDPPQVTSEQLEIQDFTCARELVEFLGEEADLSLAVAGYPETHLDAESTDADLEYLLTKQNAGASVIITQLFFDSKLYFDFVNRAKKIGINIPILPGLMPISNVQQLERFTAMCGASIPEELLERLKSVEHEPEKVSEIGVQHTIKQAIELLDGGAPGIHFYTLNKFNQIEIILGELADKFK